MKSILLALIFCLLGFALHAQEVVTYADLITGESFDYIMQSQYQNIDSLNFYDEIGSAYPQFQGLADPQVQEKLNLFLKQLVLDTLNSAEFQKWFKAHIEGERENLMSEINRLRQWAQWRYVSVRLVGAKASIMGIAYPVVALSVEYHYQAYVRGEKYTSDSHEEVYYLNLVSGNLFRPLDLFKPSKVRKASQVINRFANEKLEKLRGLPKITYPKAPMLLEAFVPAIKVDVSKTGIGLVGNQQFYYSIPPNSAGAGDSNTRGFVFPVPLQAISRYFNPEGPYASLIGSAPPAQSFPEKPLVQPIEFVDFTSLTTPFIHGLPLKEWTKGSDTIKVYHTSHSPYAATYDSVLRIVYAFDKANRLREIASYQGYGKNLAVDSKRSYIYNSQGQLILIEYYTRDNRIKKAEAFEYAQNQLSGQITADSYISESRNRYFDSLYVHEQVYPFTTYAPPALASYKYVLDSNGKVVRSFLQGNSNARYMQYDSNGNILISFTFRAGLKEPGTLFTYDDQGRLIHRSSGNEWGTTYIYDERGNVISTQDGLTISYDSMNRPILINTGKKGYPEPKFEYYIIHYE